MRCLDVLEVFGGVHSLVRGFREYGFEADVFDIRVNESHNVHSKEGLMTLARLLAHVRPPKGNREPGFVLIQPTCSTWTWVNAGTSLRNIDSCFASWAESLFLVRFGIMAHVTLVCK